MPFTVTFKQITMPTFNQSVKKVYQNHAFEDIKKAYTLKRLVEKLEIEQKRFYEMYAGIQKGFITKDDKGEAQIDPERADEFQSKIKELGETEIEIDWHALKLSDLEGVILTALDLSMLEPILDEASMTSLQEAPQTETL